MLRPVHTRCLSTVSRHRVPTVRMFRLRLTRYSGLRFEIVTALKLYTRLKFILETALKWRCKALRTWGNMWYVQAATFVTCIASNIIINISCLPHWQHICRTCTLAHHLSLGGSMVRVSHQSSEGCRFDPRLGLKNRSFEVWAGRMSIYHHLFTRRSRRLIMTFYQSWNLNVWLYTSENFWVPGIKSSIKIPFIIL